MSSYYISKLEDFAFATSTRSYCIGLCQRNVAVAYPTERVNY